MREKKQPQSFLSAESSSVNRVDPAAVNPTFDEGIVYPAGREEAVKISDKLLCGIRMTIMREPVRLRESADVSSPSAGRGKEGKGKKKYQYYEREELEQWIQEKGTHPISNEKVTLEQIEDNDFAASMSREFVEENLPGIDLSELYLPKRWIADWRSAIESSDIGRARDLVEAAPELLGLYLADGQLGFHRALAVSSVDMIDFFVEELEASKESLARETICKSPDAGTFMAHAVALESKPQLIRLLDSGIDVNQADASGDTALHHAARSGQLELVQYLVDRGADVDSANQADELAISLARTAGHTAVVDFFVSVWLHAWCEAVEKSDLSASQALYTKAPELLARELSEGSVALDAALANGTLDFVNWLLDVYDGTSSTELSSRVKAIPERWSGLEHLVLLGSEDLLGRLFLAGLDVNRCDDQGNTLLHYAAKVGDEELTSYLLKHEADFSLKNDEGLLAIDVAKQHKQKVVHTLLFNQQDTDVRVDQRLETLEGKNRKRKGQLLSQQNIIAEQKQTIAEQATKIDKHEKTIAGQAAKIDKQQQTIANQTAKIEKQGTEIADLRELLSDLRQEQVKLSAKMCGFFEEKQGRKHRRIERLEIGKRLNTSNLLECIGRANDNDLKAVKEILAKDPELIFAQGKLVEPNGREFRHISAWQHVLWSGDPSLLPMLLDHVSANPDRLAHARDQYDQLVERPQELSDHRSNYDVQPLIDAEQKYLDNYSGWNDQQRKDQWCKVIGGLQRELPAWIMYAWYEKGGDVAWVNKSLSAYTAPDQEMVLTRHTAAIDWFVEREYAGGRSGDRWASIRGGGRNLGSSGVFMGSTECYIDLSSIEHDTSVLKKCRQTPEVKDNLKSTLHAGECNIRARLRQ